MEQGGKAQRQTSPPPRGSQVPRPVVVLCLRHACDVRATEGRRKGRPTPPHQHHPPRANAGREGAKSAPPPPEDNAAGWGGRGRRVRDEPHDRARRGRAPCKPRRGDHRWCGRRIEGATEGAARLTPPPPAEGRKPRLVPTTRGQRQENDTPPPPPHKPPPPQGTGLREGKGGQRPPLSSGGGTGGEHAAWIGQRQGPRGVPHTPAGGQVPCRVPVPCLRRAYAGGRATRAHPPPPLAPTSRTHQGQRRGQRGDGEGTRGMTVAGGGPPPGDAAAGWRDRGARRPCPRGARAVQAPTGGPPGVQPQEG